MTVSGRFLDDHRSAVDRHRKQRRVGMLPSALMAVFFSALAALCSNVGEAGDLGTIPGSSAPMTGAQKGSAGSSAHEERGGDQIVLIHGLGAGAAVWSDLKPYLDDAFRVYLYEIHGHGRTRPLSDPSLHNEVVALGRWLDERDIVHPDIVGHGFGGLIALHYALERPQRVRSVTVIDADPRRLVDEELKRSIAGSLLQDYDRFVASRYVGISLVERVNEMAVDMALRTDRASLVGLLLSTFDGNPAPLLGALEAPLLVIGSEAFMPEEAAEQEYLAAYGYQSVPSLSVRRIADTGHYLMLENPKLLAATVLDWLRE